MPYAAYERVRQGDWRQAEVAGVEEGTEDRRTGVFGPRMGPFLAVRCGMPFDAAGSRAARSSAEPSRAAWFDLTALRHPGWWLALAVLVVNDQLLKGRGVVPSWLTGKLSDFALVVVAPTLVAAILPRALPWRRVAASVSVLGLFVATELFRAASDAIVAVTAQIGLYTKLW